MHWYTPFKTWLKMGELTENMGFQSVFPKESVMNLAFSNFNIFFKCCFNLVLGWLLRSSTVLCQDWTLILLLELSVPLYVAYFLLHFFSFQRFSYHSFMSWPYMLLVVSTFSQDVPLFLDRVIVIWFFDQKSFFNIYWILRFFSYNIFWYHSFSSPNFS